MAEKKKIVPSKYPMPEQPPAERCRNFEEVALGYSPEAAIAEAKRCLRCKKPTCIAGCPVEVNIPGFVGAIAEGDFRRAIEILRETNSLPAICGRVCPQETQCEKVCILAKKAEPVGIGRLERFAADWETEQGIKVERCNPQGPRVAVVGSGPAGLTFAGDMVKLGYRVVVYEALHATGGVLRYGIPEFRLPKRIVDQEVNYIAGLGVEFHLNIVVGKTYSIKELLEEEGFAGVFIGSGAGLPNFLKIPGENLNGVYSANEFLIRVNLMKGYLFPEYDTPIWCGKKAVVFGAGNVAMDSVRTAKRLGAEEASIIYRRSRVEMPARLEEIHHAEEEGIGFKLLTSPVRILDDGSGWVKGVECVQMQLGEPDASGRRRPVPIEGSEFIIDCDTVIVAIGQTPNPLIPQSTPGLTIGKWGTIITDQETGATSMDGVYAGGDVVTGTATVIEAMGAGKRAARAMDERIKKSQMG
jgi:glutamate synthase (NADPH/NADH) small chain